MASVLPPCECIKSEYGMFITSHALRKYLIVDMHHKDGAAGHSTIVI
jgi:hypothetical protein